MVWSSPTKHWQSILLSMRSQNQKNNSKMTMESPTMTMTMMCNRSNQWPQKKEKDEIEDWKENGWRISCHAMCFLFLLWLFWCSFLILLIWHWKRKRLLQEFWFATFCFHWTNRMNSKINFCMLFAFSFPSCWKKSFVRTSMHHYCHSHWSTRICSNFDCCAFLLWPFWSSFLIPLVWFWKGKRMLQKFWCPTFCFNWTFSVFFPILLAKQSVCTAQNSCEWHDAQSHFWMWQPGMQKSNVNQPHYMKDDPNHPNPILVHWHHT